MKICFFGSDDFSLAVAEHIHKAGFNICCIITKPDAARGRGKAVSQTSIASFADSVGIPVLKPASVKNAEFEETLKGFSPDIAAVCSYGKILPSNILALPKMGCINVHPSLLPKYRGATPIETAIMDRTYETGITIFQMDAGCDTGNIIASKAFRMLPEDCRDSLRQRMAPDSAMLLEEVLKKAEKGILESYPQPVEGSSLTKLIKKADTEIDWTMPAEKIEGLTRALWTAPGARTSIKGRSIIIGPVSKAAEEAAGEPGTVCGIIKNKGICVYCGDGAVLLGDIKPEGKKVMTSWQFACGCKLEKGERIG